MKIATVGVGRALSVVIVATVLATAVAACGSAASMPAGNPAEAPSAGPANGSGAKGSNGEPLAPGEAAAFKDGALIIRTGSLQLQVGDVLAATAAARSSIQGMGGYIGASQQYGDGDDIVATITYRIPAERWEDALDAFRKLGDAVGEETNSADVTGQIVDLDARIRNLRASETALVRHLAGAQRVSDVLEIEARLSDVRGQIEQLTAQKSNLDDQVAYATLTVTYGVEVQAVREAADRWDPAAEIDQAGASLVGFLQLLASAGIWLAIVGLPVLVVVAIVAAVGLFIARRFGFRRSAGSPPPTPAES